MIKHAKIIFATLISVLGLFFVTVPVTLADSPLDQACNTNADTYNSPLCQQAQTQGKKNPISGPGGVINKAANIIALITGIGAVIMILIGGFFYVTSAGNTENAAKAKARILSAFIGLVVVALAWTIVRLITDRVIR
ncbi:hypothetical protein BVY00_00970 [bacterium G20]|nr:hypothetical protein BVY00_00970 [bacterium G20]